MKIIPTSHLKDNARWYTTALGLLNISRHLSRLRGADWHTPRSSAPFYICTPALICLAVICFRLQGTGLHSLMGPSHGGDCLASPGELIPLAMPDDGGLVHRLVVHVLAPPETCCTLILCLLLPS